ncbi:MAG: hypothetical protein KF867_02350 [Cryobacterium sp.]|nr:hypothetical protein [Cryobacterium sp.]
MTSTLPNWVDIASLIVSILTCFTIGLAAIQLIFHSRQMHREFETLYVERYWVLMDKRSQAFTVGQNPTESDKTVIRGYLQLCEDEVDLRRLGRVTDGTWRFWSGAMIAQCGEPAYSAALEQLGQSMYPGLRQLIFSGGTADPLEKSWFWRMRHGL